jgi:hypothetical protein
MRLTHLLHGDKGASRSRIPPWLRLDALIAHMPDPAEDLQAVPESLPYGRAALWRGAYLLASMAAADDHLCSADFAIRCFDDETVRVEPIENPFGSKVLPMSWE